MKQIDSLPRSRRNAHAPTSMAGSQWFAGMVSEIADGGFVVTLGERSLVAQRAVSCLLTPCPGDTVACLQIDIGSPWIMAVLQRTHEADAVLSCPPGLTLRSSGELRIESASLALASPRMRLTSERVEVALGSAEIVGRDLRLVAASLRLVGSLLSSVMDRVHHFSRHYLRTTEGEDRVRATHVDVEATQLLQMQGEHTLVNGAKLVKAKGGQIHFG